jgi:hypothetical protein
MLNEFRPPVPGVVRARLIQEALATRPDPAGRRGLLIVATGKTGAGKSTLGNLLVGVDDVLRSTGYVDCTDSLGIIRFERGLAYADLPGVASKDAYENLNRAVLGLPQSPEWPAAEQVRRLIFDGPVPAADEVVPLEEVRLMPDLVLFLVATHTQIGRSENAYLRDLLAAYGPQRIVFVLNRFGTDAADGAAVEDIRSRLSEAYAALATEPVVVTMDCQRGDGLARLLRVIRTVLGEGRAEALEAALDYQHARIADVVRAGVEEKVVSLAAHASAYTPADQDDATKSLTAAVDVLASYVEALSGRTGLWSATLEAAFSGRAESVIAKACDQVTEPIVESRSKAVYHQEPVFKKKKKKDKSKPIYVTRRTTRDVPGRFRDFDELKEAAKRWNEGGKFTARETVDSSEFVGYATKKTKKLVGYRDVYDHTETWDEVVGHRVVAETWRPLGLSATACCWRPGTSWSPRPARYSAHGPKPGRGPRAILPGPTHRRGAGATDPTVVRANLTAAAETVLDPDGQKALALVIARAVGNEES